MDIEYSGNDEEYIVRNMVEKDLSQVVSRGHSRKFFSKDRTICSVFTTENLVIDNN